jgi:hypothetical protein
MGKFRRSACILTPMLLTVASLVCFVVVMLGQNTSLEPGLYFFKVSYSALYNPSQQVLPMDF